jgi:predicted nuclease of predicted toxin-antitoxin system
MRFLVDNQLPIALARWLAGKGSDTVHVLDIGCDRANDIPIGDRATADNRIVVSKDSDFFLLANRLGDSGRLLWVRLGNCRTSTLLARFEIEWPRIEQSFSDGHRIVLLA